MRHRLLVTPLLLAASVLAIAVPTTAAPPERTSSVTIVPEGCSFTVTYTWKGFSGTGLEAEVAIGYKGEHGTNVFLAWTFKPDKSGSEGAASATFTLTGATEPPRRFFGHGNLFSRSNKSVSGLKAVRDAAATSGYLEPQACGSIVSLS